MVGGVVVISIVQCADRDTKLKRFGVNGVSGVGGGGGGGGGGDRARVARYVLTSASLHTSPAKPSSQLPTTSGARACTCVPE